MAPACTNVNPYSYAIPAYPVCIACMDIVLYICAQVPHIKGVGSTRGAAPARGKTMATNTSTAAKATSKPQAPAAKPAANKGAQAVAAVVAAHTAAVAKAGGPGHAGKLLAKVYTAQPPASMASTLNTKGCKPMPPNGPSVQRWAPSTVAGASLYTLAVTHGLSPLCARYWAKCGYLTIVPPTQAQVQAMVQHWQATQGAKVTT